MCRTIYVYFGTKLFQIVQELLVCHTVRLIVCLTVCLTLPRSTEQEMEIEATDDIMRQSGSGGGETYFGTPLPRLVASRVGWLVSLLCLQSLSSLILQNYQHVIEKNMVIALFLTMLTGTAGNAGNQARVCVFCVCNLTSQLGIRGSAAEH